MGSEVHLDVYDDRLAITSPGGMYSGQTVQDLSLEEIASDRRNPILADVMAQLDYMEKRGSGLKRICNETKALEGYKEDLKPVFKSTTSQFMTTIYSMGYEPKNQQDEQYQDGIKSGLSWEQVGTKIGPKQRYFLTDKGKALLANATRNSDKSGLVEKVNHMLKKLSEEEKRIALELLHKES